MATVLFIFSGFIVILIRFCGANSCPNGASNCTAQDLLTLTNGEITKTRTRRFLLNGQCTTIGRYQVDDSNCKKYAYCSAFPNGTLQLHIFTCPTTTVFNQAIQKCTSRYQCPDTLCFYPAPRPNPNTPDCSSYIDCDVNINDITGLVTGYKGTVRYCQPGFKFDPIMLECNDVYQCPTA